MKIPEQDRGGRTSPRARGDARAHEGTQAIAAGRPLDGEPDVETQRSVVFKRSPASASRQRRTSRITKTRKNGSCGRGATRCGAHPGDHHGLCWIFFLDLARAAARSVGRVDLHESSPARLRASTISDRLFLTNNHVIASAEASAQFLVEFELRARHKQSTEAVHDLCLRAGRILLYQPRGRSRLHGDRDWRARRGRASVGRSSATVPLLDTSDKDVLGEFVWTSSSIPRATTSRWCSARNRLVSRLETVLHYKADTGARFVWLAGFQRPVGSGRTPSLGRALSSDDGSGRSTSAEGRQ